MNGYSNDSWIFRNTDGCAFALTDVRRGCTTEEQAWKNVYDSVSEMVAAAQTGVTVTRHSRTEYVASGVYDCLRGKCNHDQSEVAA